MGDFNMALFLVIPELRARGFQIHLAAWYCWQNAYEYHVRAESCGIFRIGPCEGIRICFGPSVWGLCAPEMLPNCAMMMETVRDNEGKEVETRRYSDTRMNFEGSGYPLTSYKPSDSLRREQFVQWLFTLVFDPTTPAVAGIIASATNNKGMFPFKVDTSIGSASWMWPKAPLSKQKLASLEKFDPQRELFKAGAHMPLMIFMGREQ